MRTSNAKTRSLNKLSPALLQYANTVSFVVREDFKLDSPVKSLIEDLSIYFIERRTVKEWPGTKLLLGEADIFVFNYNSEVAFILSKYSDDLFNWTHPNLPEDLVFYKDLNPVFVSISHENDAYFLVDPVSEKYLKESNLI
jgi:hypothetical protein